MPFIITQLAKRTAAKVQLVWDSIRVGKIVLVLVVYSFAGAYAFYQLEAHYSPADVDPDSGCLANFGFWAALHYAATLYTTIGYGNVYCCGTPGRVLSCFYILFGTPLLLIVLDAIGKVFAFAATKLWIAGGRFFNYMSGCSERLCQRMKARMRRKTRGSSVKPVVAVKPVSAASKTGFKDMAYKGETVVEEPTLPLSAGILFSIAWVLATAAYFQYIEGWDYGYSIYFLWITFTTVGLGDAAPSRFEYTVLNFLLLIVGLSSVSMCINILQTKIENMIKRIQANIEKQYRDRWDNMQEEIDPVTGEVIKVPGEAPEPPKGGFFGKMMKNNEEKMLKMLMSKKDEEQLEQLVAKKSEVADKAVQVDIKPKTLPPPVPEPPKEKQQWRF